MSTSHGRCSTCDVIWEWRASKWTPRVTKGEAFCEACGDQLSRTAASLAKKIPVKAGNPIRRADAAALRAKRSVARRVM